MSLFAARSLSLGCRPAVRKPAAAGLRAGTAVASLIGVTILLGGMILLGGGCQRGKPTIEPLDAQSIDHSHQRMIADLAQVAADATRDNEYFNGESRVQSYQQALDQAIAQDDLVEQLESHKSVGLALLNAGQSQQAADHLTSAVNLISQVESQQLARISDENKQTMLLQTGVAWLRLGEDQNCVHCTDGAACILPISKEAIHKQRTGSEQAMQYFRKVLQLNPRNASAIWLLNVAAMTLGEYPDGVEERYRIPAERFESEQAIPRFRNIAASLGLDTLSHAGGAIVDDFDGDDWLDVFVSNWDPAGPIRMFRNRGDGGFDDATDHADLNGITGGLNTIQADYDNDGDLDVYVLRGAWMPEEVGNKYPNSLLQNDGTGRFRDVTYAVGLGRQHCPTQTAAWADYDNDGDLDLFVGSETGRCQLYRNDAGKFTDVSIEAGVADSRGATKAVAWGDFDGDRWPDLYVSNLHHDNLLLQNNKDGTFTNVARQNGVHKPTHSFASWFWDYNNDGHLDLFVASYAVGVQYVGLDYLGVGSVTEGDCLYENTGDGNFRQVARERGLTAVTQPMGCNFGDLNNDGLLDFYLGTGYPGYDGLMPNLMYMNRGDGFDDVTFSGGFGHLQKGHGVAFADIDHDGDQDVFIELGGAYQGDAFHDALFENPGFDRNWLKIKLIGTASNRSAFGARIKVTFDDAGTERTVYRHVGYGSSFGGNPLRQEIGLGLAERVEAVEIYWPTSDSVQTFNNLDANQMIEITEGESELRRIDLKAVSFDAS